MRFFQDKNKPDYKAWKPWLILIIIMVIGFALDARAYELPDKFRKWNVKSIDVYYNTSGCNIRTVGLWHRAARKWGVINVSEKGEHEYIGYDNRPTLYCAEKDLAALSSLPKGVVYRVDYVRSAVGNLILASAHSYFKDGALLDCDIRLSTVFVTDENVEKVVLHELGHCLGIDHSLDPKAAMYWTINNDHSGLHADDLLAACDLYAHCPQWDSQLNLVIQPFEYKDECFYGYLIAGGVWPNDAELSEC